MAKERAFVWWNAGVCHVVDETSRRPIATSVHFRRATRRARRLGYAVRVYKGEHAMAPRDAVQVTAGSYVLPAVKGLPRVKDGAA